LERAVPDWGGFFCACNPPSELFHIRCQRVLTALNGKQVCEHTFSALPAGFHEPSLSGLTAGLCHLQCTSGALNLMTRKMLLGEEANTPS